MAFKEMIQKNTQVPGWRGNIPVEFIYTVGQAGERFFHSLKDSGKILGVRCSKCGISYVPPRIFCERCMRELSEFYDAGRKGRVLSYTKIYRDARGNKLNEPKILGIICFDRAMGGLLHYIKEDKPETLKIGAEVEAVLEKSSERKGLITDIKYFITLSNK